MITLTTEQAQQIEEALDELRYANNTDIAKTKYYKALSTIRAARAREQAEQEPVAFIGQGLKPIVPEDLEKLRKHEPGMATLYDTPLYAAPVQQAEQEPVAYVGDLNEFTALHLEREGYAFTEPLYAAPQPITTPDVCGEVCVRAKLCYGCGKALDEANASWMSHDELKAYWSGYGNGKQKALSEPVAWGRIFDGDIIDCICPEEHALNEGDYTVPLYAAPVQQAEQEPTVSDGVCGGCAKKAADGWALYCVECCEKAEQGPVKRFTSDDVKVAFENGYAAAMSVADIAKEAEQEPVAIVDEIGLCLDGRPIFNAVGKVKVGQKLYASPVRTKDLTDDDLEKTYDEICRNASSSERLLFRYGRAVIQEYRRKNGIV